MEFNGHLYPGEVEKKNANATELNCSTISAWHQKPGRFMKICLLSVHCSAEGARGGYCQRMGAVTAVTTAAAAWRERQMHSQRPMQTSSMALCSGTWTMHRKVQTFRERVFPSHVILSGNVLIHPPRSTSLS